VTKKRRTFTEEFKAEAVRLVRESGKSIGGIAKDLGVWETVLRRWMQQSEADAGRGPDGVMTTHEKAELRRLRRELKQVTMERDILKKATAFFAKGSL